MTTGDLRSADLLTQEDELALDHFDLGDAIGLGETALALARESGHPVLIEVRHGERIAFRAALPGTTADNDDWLERKRRVVRRFEHSTMAIRVRYEEQGTDFNTATALVETEYAAHGGGWPVRVRGVGVVGFLGISGLPQVQDHELIVATLRAFIARSGRR